MTRRKPFLTYFVASAIPLLLLAGLNYWNGLRSVDATVSTTVQNDLNALNVGIDNALRERKSDFLRLSMMDALPYLTEIEHTPTKPAQADILKVKQLPELSREFQTLIVFDIEHHPRLVRQGEGEWTGIPSSELAKIDRKSVV